LIKVTTHADQEQNEQRPAPIAQPDGDLFRRYWIPALHSWEIAELDRAPRVQIVGEKLGGFRDSEGRIGVIDEFARTAACPRGSAGTRNAACAVPTAGSTVNGQCVDCPQPEGRVCARGSPKSTRRSSAAKS
jgi:phenylpropionate dioxygenase-like ring-hydroxylating dioxygenase large terminal subunit